MKFTYQFGAEKFEYWPALKEIEKVLTPILMAKHNKMKTTVENMLDDELYFEEMCEEYKDVLEDWFYEDAEREYENILNEEDEGSEYYPYFERRIAF